MHEFDAAYDAYLDEPVEPAWTPAPGKRTLTAAIQRSAAPAPAPAATPTPAENAAPSGPANAEPAADPFWFCGGGEPLAAPVRTQMEQAFGTDFSGVRVHVGDAAPSVGALAFAQGEGVHFAPGQYDPDSARGQALIGHELAHVVQQRQGRVATPQGKGAPINADATLEAEADAAGAAVAAGRSIGGALAGSDARATTGSAAIQRKVGFEVEVNILLSRGGPSQGEEHASEPHFVTGSDLMTGAYSDPEALDSKYGTRMVLVKTKLDNEVVALRWDKTSYAKHDRGTTTIKPTRLREDEPGRWLVIQGWKPTEKPLAQAFDPHLGKSDKVFSKTDDAPYDVVEDHVAQPLASDIGSILEFVTQPRDEFEQHGETPEDAKTRFLAPIRAVRQKVEAIEGDLGGRFTPRVPAARYFPGARSDLYIGWDGNSSQTHHGSLQATFGIQLAGVAPMMKERTQGFDLLKEPGILEKAMKAAGSARHELGAESPTYDRLDGFFHLICMYLVAGDSHYLNLCSLDKNHVPYLIRHGLPSIRKAGLSEAETKLLLDRKPEPQREEDKYSFLSRDWVGESQESIIDVLARAAGRSSGQALFSFKQGQLSVKTWLEAVLYGDADPLMNDFWGEAKEISPETVGPERYEPGTGEPLEVSGAILEQRHAAPGPQAPEQWDVIAESYFNMMRRYNR